MLCNFTLPFFSPILGGKTFAKLCKTLCNVVATLYKKLQRFMATIGNIYYNNKIQHVHLKTLEFQGEK